MKIFVTILLFSIAISASAQSGVIPIADSNFYDMSGATAKGTPCFCGYFAPGDFRITREVADFNRDTLAASRNGLGLRGIAVLRKRYKIDSIKYFDPSGSVDTAWIWTLKQMVKPDTLSWPINYTPDYTIISCGTCAGLPITTKINAVANDTAEVIFIVLRKTTVTAFGSTFHFWPNIQNIRIYGTEVGPVQDTTYLTAHWAENQWTAKPIKKIIGNFNLQNQQDTLWSDTAFRHIDSAKFRTFDQQFFYNAYTHKLNMGGYGYTWNLYNQAMYRQGHKQFSVVFGNNNYYSDELDSAGYTNQKGWSTNTIYADPQKPSSYSEKGHYMRMLAWIGGGPGGTYMPGQTYNGDSTAHRGYVAGLGSTNEATLFAFPRAWKTPWEVANECHGIYDSIKLGDPNMPVIVGAYEAFNYPDAKATILGLKIIARSRNIKADGLAFHGYHSLKTDSFPVIPTGQQQIGNHGVDVGYWDDWRKTIHYCTGIFAETGNANFIVQEDEDGMQKGLYVPGGPRFDGDNISQIGTPRYHLKTGATLDAFNSQAVAVWKCKWIATASPLAAHYHYAAVDDNFSSDNPYFDAVDQDNGLFARPVDFSHPPIAWPSHWLSESMEERIGDYRFVDSVSDVTRGLYLFHYVHQSIPDSNLYIPAVMDTTGTASFSITGINNSSVQEIDPSFTSRQVSQTTVGITGGVYNGVADPLPRGIIVFSPAGGGGGGGGVIKIKVQVRLKGY